MTMNPRTHPRGAAPDFTLPKPNPNPARMTDALWWLACMRERLEPASQNGGTYANKAGSHNTGDGLINHRDSKGNHPWRDDHSIRHSWNRTGPWWRTKTAAHDWTFPDAQRGDFRTINRYTRREINAMRDPKDLRPDRVIFYVLGQTDTDRVVEGYSEITDDETTGDSSHLWHIHNSFFRMAVGSFAAMWQVLTIDMGWTYAEWQRSVSQGEEDMVYTEPQMKAFPWQYAGGGIPEGMSTLGVLNYLYNAVTAIGLKVDIDATELGQIRAAAQEGAQAALAESVDDIVEGVVAGLDPSNLTIDGVRQAVRDVLLTGAQPDQA
jgi:hypothetical protein